MVCGDAWVVELREDARFAREELLGFERIEASERELFDGKGRSVREPRGQIGRPDGASGEDAFEPEALIEQEGARANHTP